MLPSSHSRSWLLVLTLFILAAFPAWVRGGTPRDLQGPLPWLGGIALVIAGTAAGRSPSGGPVGVMRWLRDPVFYAGALFLGLLGLQWYNAGRVLFFDPVAAAWGYTAPPRPGWPSAFSRPEAAEMLRWFFPAWAAILVVRSGALGRAGAIRLLRLLALNAAVIGLAGMVQQQLGTWFFPYTAWLPEGLRIFAGFGYENHAASFFVLTAALSAGLAVRDMVAPDRRRRRGWVALMLAAFALNLAAAHFSLSRAGILMAWLLVAAGTAWGAVRAWHGLSPIGRINAFAGGGAVLLTVAMAIAVVGRDNLGREMLSIGHLNDPEFEQTNAPLPIEGRLILGRAAMEMLLAQPAFGLGGWGYRYMLPLTAAAEPWKAAAGPGRANAHNDPLQFLAEFGTVGAGLMAIVVMTMLIPLFRRSADGRRPSWSDPVVFFALLGALLVWLHSLIDLPFRSPAVLVMWTMVLAGAGELARGQRSVNSEHHAA